MFNIQKLEIKNNRLFITDRDYKIYSTAITNPKLTNLLSLASYRSGRINKNIKYMNNYFKVALICGFICLSGALMPVITGQYYAELSLIMFGGLSAVSFSLASASKLFVKWLKKYAINNEYWEEIYDLLVSDQSFNNSYTKQSSLDNTINNVKRPVVANDCTYSFSKKDIIQDYSSKDKVKVYKK